MGETNIEVPPIFMFSDKVCELLSSLETCLTENLHSLLDFERSLASTCACSLVTILCLSSSVLCESLIGCSNLSNKFFHRSKILIVNI